VGDNFNRYWYANNNPYRFMDPDGRQSRETVNAPSTGVPFWDWFITPSDVRASGKGQMMREQLAAELSRARSWTENLGYVAIAMSLGTRGLGGAGRLLGRSETTRVGRWMSTAEYRAMKASGVVQADANGMHRVAVPASPDAYKAAPKGDIYVEYDLPTSSLSPGGTDAWRTVHGPGSPMARLAEKKGLPPPQLPKFTNLSEPLRTK
jgi:hypothetical protein